MAKAERAVWAASLAMVMLLAMRPLSAEPRHPLRWMTARPGSYGYKVAAAMAKFTGQTFGGQYDVGVSTFTSPAVAMKAAMAGDGELAYASDIEMAELHNRVGGFRGYRPPMPMLAHTWYAFSMESMMAVAAKNAGHFKCWKDFSGKPVFFTPVGFMNWLNFQRIFRVLGYDFSHAQIDVRSNADALDTGKIAGSVVYTIAGRELPPYWKETVLKTDIAIVNPCADEVAKLKAAGLTIVHVDPGAAFGKGVGPKTLEGVSVLFGYNARLDEPADMVYQLVKTFYERRDELAKSEHALANMARDFIGMQAQGINANPAVPVHAGLARFLKEHNAWNDKWTVGAGKS